VTDATTIGVKITDIKWWGEWWGKEQRLSKDKYSSFFS